MMTTSQVRSIGLRFTKKLLPAFAIVLLILTLTLAVYIFWIGALSPALIWLEYGKWPERDFLYLLGSSDCSDTYWRSSWQTLKDWCRPESINVTNWVGLDKLLNYLLDLNVSLVGIPVSFVVMAKVTVFLDKIGALDHPKARSAETENQADNV